VASGIPPEFIDNSLVSRPLARAEIDTVVGENGVQLLVTDEATSALDAETERIITETLDSLAGDVTSIVIAHRLATV
jgi:ABC-type multidrug transport system fused ATPase/permease subunit